MDGGGLKPPRNESGIPFVIPPNIPPQLLVMVTIFPPSTANSSLFSLPYSSADPNPAPNSIPFTAGIQKTIEELLFSIPPTIRSPIPSGTPVTLHPPTPPTE